MNIFLLIAHASLLIHTGEDIQTIAQNLAQHKERVPSEAEFLALVDDAINILSTGIIKVGADVTKKMIDALTALRTSFPAKV